MALITFREFTVLRGIGSGAGVAIARAFPVQVAEYIGISATLVNDTEADCTGAYGMCIKATGHLKRWQASGWPSIDIACHDRNGTRNWNVLTNESAGAKDDELVEALWRGAQPAHAVGAGFTYHLGSFHVHA